MIIAQQRDDDNGHVNLLFILLFLIILVSIIGALVLWRRGQSTALLLCIVHPLALWPFDRFSLLLSRRFHGLCQ